ncbi:hypothetical protein [Streptomyces sp. NPDC058084]|uniref:hypothetical protein n=1 Tax=Streptomyces sp. NPDC058084 TaxID=3346333 RepID=UPI0036EC8BC0
MGMKRSAWCKNAGELAALLAVANFVREDLTGCWASQLSLAETARVTDRTIRTHLRALEERRMIVPGDDQLVAHLPKDNRPDVWDLNKDLPVKPPRTGKDFRSPTDGATGKSFRSRQSPRAGKFCGEGPEILSDEPVMVDPGNSVGGDGRRPSTGSGGRDRGGGAASSRKPSKRKVAAADVRRVVQALPAPLVDRLDGVFPQGLPASFNEAVAHALLDERRTVDQLVARVERRWLLWSYEQDAVAESGAGLDRPVGVLLKLLGPSACWGNHARCEDGVDIDTGVACPRCEEAREDKAASSRPPEQPASGYSVPFEPAADREPSPYVQCGGDGCGRKMLPTADGLCRECREYERV